MKFTCCLVSVFILFALLEFAVCFECTTLLQDEGIQSIRWTTLKWCLKDIGYELNTKKLNENIWRLTKIAFDGVENIPATAFKEIVSSLTAITVDELHNISMDVVEIVDAFGSIRSSDLQTGFNEEQLKVLAQKVRTEWIGKEPKTYSEYDLILMGEIICHFNVTDIEDIHVDAFKEAIEWIGKIANCPEEQLQTFASLAMRSDGLRAPDTWSKLEVSLVGNIINGLPQNMLMTIDEDKLHLNRFYKSKLNDEKVNKNKIQ